MHTPGRLHHLNINYPVHFFKCSTICPMLMRANCYGFGRNDASGPIFISHLIITKSPKAPDTSNFQA